MAISLNNAERQNSDDGADAQSISGEMRESEKKVVAQEHSSPSEHAINISDVDDTTVFYNLNKHKVGLITPEMEKKVVRRNFWFLLGQTWWIAFLIHLDKSTLSQASTMGIFQDVSMTKKEYNDLFVVFYTGYLIALWPGAWLSQRTGQKNFIVGSLFLWAFLLGMHTVVKTGKQLIALRFILGMVSLLQTGTKMSHLTSQQTESQIVPSTTVLHQAFFPPKRSPWIQLLWWASGSLANVLLTMVAYKLILEEGNSVLVGGLSSWKWLHIICVILTFVVCVPLYFFLPNSPVDAKWLSAEEKIMTISSIRESQSGIKNSSWKWPQVREAFTDLKSWFFMYAPSLTQLHIVSVYVNMASVFTCSSTNSRTTHRNNYHLLLSALDLPLQRVRYSTLRSRSLVVFSSLSRPSCYTPQDWAQAIHVPFLTFHVLLEVLLRCVHP